MSERLIELCIAVIKTLSFEIKHRRLISRTYLYPRAHLASQGRSVDFRGADSSACRVSLLPSLVAEVLLGSAVSSALQSSTIADRLFCDFSVCSLAQKRRYTGISRHITLCYTRKSSIQKKIKNSTSSNGAQGNYGVRLRKTSNGESPAIC